MIHEHTARSRSACCAMVWYVWHLWCSAGREGYTLEVVAPDRSAAMEAARAGGHVPFMYRRGPAA